MNNRKNQTILNGKTIICTYPQKEHDEFFEIISSFGANVLSMPMIEIVPVAFNLQSDMATFDWLIFTSKNGVSSFFAKQAITKKIKVAALGKSTALELLKNDIQADFTGSGKSGENFAAELIEIIQPNEKVLLVLGELAPDLLQPKLAKTNLVERINVYKTIVPKEINNDVLTLINSDNYDLIIVTSPSAVKNLVSVVKTDKTQLRMISIGKTTTSTIRELNMEPLVTSANSSYKSLAEITLEYLKKDHKNIKL